MLYATAQDHQVAFPFGTGLGPPPSVSVSGPSFAGGLWDAFSAFTPFAPPSAPLGGPSFAQGGGVPAAAQTRGPGPFAS